MTDAEKKDTLCLFITPFKRVKKGDRYYLREAKKYFKKFRDYGVLPLEYVDDLINEYCIDAINDNDVKNVQMIFDIHGNEEGLSISETEMRGILEPILYSLGDKKLEIIMANCQGNLKFKKNNVHGSLPECLKDMAEKHGVKPENISLYCMPEGHDTHIQFNKNGDIFFINDDASYSTRNDYKDNTIVESFYTKEDQEEGKPNTRITYNKDYVEIQAKKPFDEKGNKIQPLLQGVYKDRPPIKIDISTCKPFPTDLVPYKQPLAFPRKQGIWQKVKVTKKKKTDNHKPSISGQTNKQGIWQNVKVTKKNNHEPSISGQKLIDKLLDEF